MRFMIKLLSFKCAPWRSVRTFKRRALTFCGPDLLSHDATSMRHILLSVRRDKNQLDDLGLSARHDDRVDREARAFIGKERSGCTAAALSIAVCIRDYDQR